MLVGDVRRASTGSGSSWKLSGGRPPSSGFTNVSKKRHVRRATSRAVRICSGERTRLLGTCGGKLMRQANTGDSTQRRTKGAATGHALGLRKNMSVPETAPSATPHRRCPKKERSRRSMP